MPDQFPLRPDADWYDAMIARYADALPAVDHLQIRRGLHAHVAHLFEQLHDLGLLYAVDIKSIVTRNAGFIVIDARYADGLSDSDRAALDFALDGIRGDLTEACEHCGKPGEIIAKTGLEACLADPDVELGDRLLCMECYESWRSHD
ncbi:hypothetical protein [Rhizobium sp. P007]|uniref:hypothetical protein n=1 Tax=Rhizobium sp. P007 TaxID=285908 RepID=UPI00115B0BE1|nr:hypothetical protein [Rhizobium sp. P007]CAD7058606.1 hypothetical protein RP007_02610 [Rhizobium sp. P007]